MRTFQLSDIDASLSMPSLQRFTWMKLLQVRISIGLINRWYLTTINMSMCIMRCFSLTMNVTPSIGSATSLRNVPKDDRTQKWPDGLHVSDLVEKLVFVSIDGKRIWSVARWIHSKTMFRETDQFNFDLDFCSNAMKKVDLISDPHFHGRSMISFSSPCRMHPSLT